MPSPFPAARRPRRRIAAIAASALAGAALVGLSAAPSVAAPTGTTSPAPSSSSKAGAGATSTQKATFGLQPATKGKPDARPYLQYQTSPGGTFTDNVSLLNFGTIPLDLQLYMNNLSNAADGTLAVAAEQTKAKDAANWEQLAGGPRTVHIGPRTAQGPSQVLLPVRLAVPTNATPGDHVAAMVASLETIGRNPKGENVRLLQRVALRVYVRVNGDLHAHYSVANMKVKYHGTLDPIGNGSADITYTLRNDGNVSIGLAQKAKLSGWFGATGSVPKIIDVPVLLPGNSVPMHVRVSGVRPEFKLTAKITATPIRTGTSTDTLLASTTASASTWALPWPLVLAILVLAALVFGAWKLSRQGRRAYAGSRRS
jgi:hypothetical protein